MPAQPGRKVFVEIDLAHDPAARNWQKVSQQRDGTLNRTTDDADATHKDDDGWADSVTTRRNWSVDSGGVLLAADPVLAYIKTRFNSSLDVWVRVREDFTGGETDEGLARIANYSKNFAYLDVEGFTLTFVGKGELAVA